MVTSPSSLADSLSTIPPLLWQVYEIRKRQYLTASVPPPSVFPPANAVWMTLRGRAYELHRAKQCPSSSMVTLLSALQLVLDPQLSIKSRAGSLQTRFSYAASQLQWCAALNAAMWSLSLSKSETKSTLLPPSAKVGLREAPAVTLKFELQGEN